MKKLIQLSIFLLALLLPATALAGVDINGVYYTIDGNEATLSYGRDVSGDFVIPESISYNGTDYPVTAIGNNAFYSAGLTSVTIPNTVVTIGNSAFYRCSSLSDVTLGSSVTTIGDYAFCYCGNLTAITIPNSVTTIGYAAFYGCSSMTSLSIGNSVSSVAVHAFTNCPELTSITVASDNTVYDSRGNCNAIIETATNTLIAGCQTTVIPNTVTAIGDYAFYRCTGLTGIDIPASVTAIGDAAFYYCTGLTSIDIPASVTSIGRSAFYGCSNLANITIPASVTSIGSGAFTNTAWFYNQPDGVIYIGTIAYKYKGEMPSGTRIVIKEGTTDILYAAFYSCSGLTAVEIPSTVVNIGEAAFADCPELTSITVASGNTVYDSRGNCNAIIETATNTLIAGCQTTVIPNTVTAIGNYAFYGCTGLNSIDIPASVTSIGMSAFDGCTGLTGVVIPNSVTSIGTYAFDGCAGLTSVTLPNSITAISDGLFQDCIALANVIIPNTVKSIGYNAFRDCVALARIAIPGSVNSIESQAFQGCTSLKDVYSLISYYYDNYTGEREGLSMGYYVFELEDDNYADRTLHVLPGYSRWYQQDGQWSAYFGNIVEMSDFEADGIRYKVIGDGEVAVTYKGYSEEDKYSGDIVIPETVTDLGITYRVTAISNGAFEDCRSLTSVTLPSSITTIGNCAFDGCYNLTSVTLPESVATAASIGERAFRGCFKLKGITIPEGVTSIGDGAFECCYRLTEVTIPRSLRSIGITAFGHCYSLSHVEWNAQSCVHEYEYFDFEEDCFPFEYCPSLKKITIGSGVESIGDDIFCIFDPNYSNIDTVMCLATQPPVIGEDCFWTYTYSGATLCVPRQSMSLYVAAEGWKEFATIEGMNIGLLPGDTDGDGKVGIADVTTLIDSLLNGSQSGLNTANADMDGDGRISIADVTALIDTLLSTH